jgi:hypothetical protein
MKLKILTGRFVWGVLLGWIVQPASVWACTACYGQSDSPMARGLNWGIFTLLAVVVGVLGTFASFFVYLSRKSAAPASNADSDQLISSNKV